MPSPLDTAVSVPSAYAGPVDGAAPPQVPNGGQAPQAIPQATADPASQQGATGQPAPGAGPAGGAPTTTPQAAGAVDDFAWLQGGEPQAPGSPASQDDAVYELTEADKQAILAAPDQQAALAYVQQEKKRLHDRHSQTVQRVTDENRALKAQVDILMQTNRGGAPPPQYPPQQGGQPPAVPPRVPGSLPPSVPGPQGVLGQLDYTQLPEYQDWVNAEPEQYHEKHAKFIQAAHALHDQAFHAEVEAERFDRYLDETQTGDEVNPIPWKERKAIFSQMVQADPRLLDRLPNGSAEDRYLWITAQVNQARPDIYRGRLRESLIRSRDRTNQKNAAAPIASGTSAPASPQSGAPGSAAQNTASYLTFLKSGRGGQ